MPASTEILARLQREILSLQGFTPLPGSTDGAVSFGPINQAFPNRTFPLSAVHEFYGATAEEATASGAFVTGILSSLLRKGGAALWISSSRLVYPPALSFFGVQPHQVIFLDLQKEKDVAWAVEEALQCRALAAVVGELKEMSFTASRRFQLAIEKSGVALFALRKNPGNSTTAAVTRWQIRPLASRVLDDLPGVGHPRWQVTLLKVRNGKPGSWEMEWIDGRFCHVPKLAAIHPEQQKKTG